MKNNSLTIRELKIGQKSAKNAANAAPSTINGINFTLQAGGLLLIKGASGSGKSLLLKAIAGIARPDSGDIHLNEQPITRAQTVYIGSQTQLIGYRSLKYNVRRRARASGNPELYDAAMDYFELESLSATRINHLSDGYRQRALLTQLITKPCAVWLLDDPFAYLDEAGSALLNALIQTRLEQHGIVLLATNQNFSGERVKILNLSEPADQVSTMH